MGKLIKLMFILLVTGLIVVVGCGNKVRDPAIDALANCLADNGVKEYGAFWCPNCAKQEKLFGASEDIIKGRGVYVECDPRCDKPLDDLPKACKGVRGQPGVCLANDVQAYPHWQFSDGSTLVGTRSLSEIASKAGCVYEA